MATSSSMGSGDTLVEAQIQQLLEEAGLESAPFDAASLEALKRHFRQQKGQFLTKTNPLVAVAAAQSPEAEEKESSPPDLTEEDEEEPPVSSVDIYGPTSPAPAEEDVVDATPSTLDPSRTLMDTESKSPTHPVHPTSNIAGGGEKPVLPHPMSSLSYNDPDGEKKASSRWLAPMNSDMTDPGSSSIRMNFSSTVSSRGSKTEARILEQLQVQTTLLLQLQRRVDELTSTVKQQQDQINHHQLYYQPNNHGSILQNPNYNVATSASSVPFTAPKSEPSSTQTTPEVAATRNNDSQRSNLEQSTEEERATAAAATAAAEPLDPSPPPVQEPQPAAAAPPAANRQREAAAVERRGFHVMDRIRNNRVVGLYRVFQKMRQQEVNDVQWGVIIKVLIMMSILLGRIASSSSRKNHARDNDHDSSFFSFLPSKSYILIGMVVLGLLGQTGYFFFFYKFFVKEKYPVRILLLGEDVQAILDALDNNNINNDDNNNNPAPPGPPRRDGAAAQPNNNNGEERNPNEGGGINWAHTFLLGGRIARPENQQPQVQVQPGGGGFNLFTAVWNIISDIIYLLGSFVLSIFPMWRPQAAAQPMQPVGVGEQQPLARDAPPQPQPNYDNNNGNNGPGQVRPPQDPAAADDDGDY